MKVTVFWFRRDLRWHDNAGLYHALQQDAKVLPLFIFDEDILDELDPNDRRVNMIHQALREMQTVAGKHNSTLIVRNGRPLEVFKKLLEEYEVQAVFTNRDYEPYALERDKKIERLCQSNGIPFRTFKDQVVYETDEISKDDGSAYIVYTPFKNAWKKRYVNEQKMNETFDSESLLANLIPSKSVPLPSLKDIGFQQVQVDIPSKTVEDEMLAHYQERRDYPAVKNGTSGMSPHLRFGTVSPRELAKIGYHHNEKWLDELVWREFYSMILSQFPRVVDHAFREQYDELPWRNDPDDFERWCNGKTGIPLVDAGMRQLVQSGHMHNRVRMVAASFLTKNLLIDWRWGERFFAKWLLDYDLASNNGNWQWNAGTGVDAAPYFRVFNPNTQLEKFDPERKYVKKWVEEYGADAYPEPMVDLKATRQRAIDVFKATSNR